MTTSQLGNIGEAKVLSEFTKLGIPCYLPYGDGNTVDLIAQFNNKLNKIQIKTTASLNKVGAMEWKVTKQEGYHGNRTQYKTEEVDYFAFYCFETDIVCLVPFDENFPTNTLSIRLDDYQGKILPSMRFARDYQIVNYINL